MKSVKFSALMAVAVIAASCAKEGTHSVDESDKVALEPMCIEASDESQTKTVLVEKSVNWTDGDKIAVYSNINYNKGYIFPATDIKGNSATFNGEVPVGTTSFFAVYPLERVVSVNEQGVTVNIPAEQTPAAGTFAEEHNITVAQGTKTPGEPSVENIIFNNVCSYVKFTVPAYVSDVTEVKITSSNDIAGDFATASSKIVSNGTNSISMSSKSGSFGAGQTFIFVIAPGTVSNFSIDIKTASGNWTRTVSKGFDAKAGVPNNLGTIHFKQVEVELKPEAKHVYQNGTLVGTDLSVNLGLLKYVSNFNFVVKKGDTVVRSYSRESSEPVASSTVSFAWKDYADYPYLPQGEYTIEGSYTRPGDGSKQTISSTFAVTEKEAPTFTVNAPLATTSYDTYKDLGAGEANKKDGSTIYGVAGNGVSISDKILKNTEYKSLIGGYSFTIDGNPVTVDGNGNATNQTWKAHKVVAKFTFDGVEKTSEALTCHVTGLPYNKNKDNTTNFQSDWTMSGVTSEWAKSFLYYGNGSVNFKGFYIPSNIKATVYYKIIVYVSTRFNPITTTFTSAGTLLVNETIEGTAREKKYESSGDVIFSSSNNSMQAKAKCKNPPTWGSSHDQLHYVSVIYR